MFLSPHRHRPLGVTVLAILLALGGILTLVSAFIVPGQVSSGGMDIVLFILGGLINLLLAYGLWTLRRWAFWTTVIITALNVFNWGLSLLTGSLDSFTVANFVVYAIILIYLFADRNVRAAFQS